MAENVPIEERAKRIVSTILYVKEAKLTRSTSFVDDLGADSLDTVELMMAFEEEFNGEIKREIPDSDYEKLQTLGEVVDYINAAAGESRQTFEIENKAD
jgi:acyl carrier protein